MCIQKEEITAILELYRDIIINVPDVYCSCDDACFVQVSLRSLYNARNLCRVQLHLIAPRLIA